LQKALAKKLRDFADEVACRFSQPSREFNYNQETFHVQKIRPLSETTACVYFKKSSGKMAIGFFYWLASQGGQWKYFFPTESHVHGMKTLADCLLEVEAENWVVSTKT